ncbi:MAG: LLM class flavin-dependent oxidoreductase [Myxococcales bacterium]|nr:LLM class flavin-dependent oxidoreductase [Myxococcales bacterium]MCB9530798.1 LLM class flavin-dependent oxidoreductase [Myxococcales bacterium]
MAATHSPSFIVGEGTLVIQCAQRLLDAGFDIRGIVTRERSVAQWAGGAGIDVLDPSEPWADQLRAEPFDYLFSIVNLEMLPGDLVGMARRMAINFHDGPLPRYAGINATSWALLARETDYAVTWHEMVAEADRGRILVQRPFAIAPDDTAFSLNAKCFDAGMESFGELVDALVAGTLEPTPQDFSRRSYFGKFMRPDAASALDLTSTPEDLAAFVAAHDFGQGYANPLGLAAVVAAGRVLYVGGAEPCGERSGKPAGTIVAAEPRGLRVATSGDDVRLVDLRCHLGSELDPAVLSSWGIRAGVALESIDRDAATALVKRTAKHEPAWGAVLAALTPAELPGEGAGDGVGAAVSALGAASLADAVATIAAFVGRVSGHDTVSLALELGAHRHDAAPAAPLFGVRVPVTLDVAPASSAAEALAGARAAVELAVARGPIRTDLYLRQPGLGAIARDLSGLTLPIVVRDGDTTDSLPGGVAVVFSFDASTGDARWSYDRARLSDTSAAALARQLTTFAASLPAAARLGDASLLDAAEREAVLAHSRGPALPYDRAGTIGSMFAAKAASTPAARALTFSGKSLTYAEVDAAVNRLARHLRAAGVRPDSLVGVFMERSADLVIAALAVMRAGGAYVPLDPDYPAERVAFMVEDAGVGVVLTQERVRARVPGGAAAIISIDGDAAAIERHSDGPLEERARPDSLAYVIYTSGSTGKPKGVMVEHRNAANFFAGMDERLGHTPESAPGVWLAVTSLNFDISVLELFWSLTRGFEVVVFSEDRTARGFVPRHPGRRMEFGAFYFSSDESEGLVDKYQLLIEGARFADRNGFNSVWTPERHFHAFGGLFPNPAVTSAALATITQNVQLRAGSCVTPLHSVIRVAEDWSVVDNLSKGRVGLSVAAGWQPNDFVIRPDAFADRRNQMFRDIETLRKFWRGESVPFPDGEGRPVEVRIMPRPYSKELPIWVTAAGNPATFREAGECGANLLTHLLGQTLEELAEKIAIYREARAKAGWPGRGIVSLMLHTYVGTSDEEARATVREPMKSYLRSAVGLVKAAAWSFPTFKKTTTMEDGSFSIDHLSEDDMDAVLDHAFERYYDTAGLFGTVDTCVEFVDKLKGLDVDEIPALIDFGIPTPTVLAALPRLADVLRLSNQFVGVHGSETDFSIPALIRRHGVTHFQCTPSMASMLLIDDEVRAALGSLRKFLVGGEALPAATARELEKLVGGDVINMYGPTETTVWSATHAVRATDEVVPIGTPIANTTTLVLDRLGGLLPAGAMGELCIGGDGVVRGYLNRPELTAERFVKDPFSSDPSARFYRTGDLARVRPDGVLEFHGRLDHQVKVRGYRIELGEIEARLTEHPSVRTAAVIVREDTPGDKRIVAYIVAGGPTPEVDALRAHIAETLPDYMVPAAFVTLDRMPETPNRKIDRNALPAPEATKAPAARKQFTAPSSKLEETIADIWCEVLAVPRVGTQDNFFDLGGHSLLTIQVHGRLKQILDRPLSLVDLFRYPTVAALARHLDDGGEAAEQALAGAAERAAGRRDAMAKRRAMRVR